MPFGKHSWVLVVEDDIDLRTMLVLHLQMHGYPTVGVSNGVEALRLLVDPTKHLPRLIILNLSMPIMDGTTLLRILAISERLMGIPICIASGEVNIPVEPGQYHILKKPYEMEDILHAVQGAGVEQMNNVPKPHD